MTDSALATVSQTLSAPGVSSSWSLAASPPVLQKSLRWPLRSQRGQCACPAVSKYAAGLCQCLDRCCLLLAAYAFLLAACAVPVFCMAVVETPVGYIIERLFIGCSLAAFVVCQFWSSIMFSPTVVGLSNAVAGGWGNAGELLTLLPAFACERSAP